MEFLQIGCCASHLESVCRPTLSLSSDFHASGMSVCDSADERASENESASEFVRAIVLNDDVLSPRPPQEVHARNGCGDDLCCVHPPIGLPSKLLRVRNVRLRSLHAISRIDVCRVQV